MTELSLHLFFGWLSPTTTKIRGKIGKTSVIVLIDSGATHNFISPDIVEKSHIETSAHNNFTILVGMGISVKGSLICKGVNLHLQAVKITSDFIVLEPGSADIILGVQWLRTHGTCEVDWEKQILSFITKEEKITLHGDVETSQSKDNITECSSGVEWSGMEMLSNYFLLRWSQSCQFPKQ